MTMIFLTEVGVLRSISDDDQCSACAQCVYMPGAMSACKQKWPTEPDADGYIGDCTAFEQKADTTDRAVVMLDFGMAPIARQMGFPVIKDLFVGTGDEAAQAFKDQPVVLVRGCDFAAQPGVCEFAVMAAADDTHYRAGMKRPGFRG